MKKIYLGIKSVIMWMWFKVKYRASVNMSLINSIKGKLLIDITKGGKLSIGSFLMTSGPCYIKLGEQGKLEIGNKCFMNHNVSITCNDSILIGDDCNIANNVVIVDHNHKMTHEGILGETFACPVKIGDKCWIGANCTITAGTEIGDGAAIAAGAVVKGRIPSHELWGGGHQQNSSKIFERFKYAA